MLKVTVQTRPQAIEMKLEGRVAGLWAAEVSRSWESLSPLLGSRTLVVDLSDVTFVDREGRRVLHEIYRKDHARFLTSTPLTKFFADEAMLGSDENEHKISATQKGK